MSIKSKAKKIGKAIIFKKMFEDLMAKKERKEADFSILIEHIEVWKEESPDDLNAILASILVKAQDASPDDIKAEYEQAKAEYHAEDEQILPWFESQIENITNEDENVEVDIEQGNISYFILFFNFFPNFILFFNFLFKNRYSSCFRLFFNFLFKNRYSSGFIYFLKKERKIP